MLSEIGAVAQGNVHFSDRSQGTMLIRIHIFPAVNVRRRGKVDLKHVFLFQKLQHAQGGLFQAQVHGISGQLEHDGAVGER